MIQKSNIKFSYRDTSFLKDTSPNSQFFSAEISPKNLDSMFGQNRATCDSLEKRTITWVIDVQFG